MRPGRVWAPLEQLPSLPCVNGLLRPIARSADIFRPITLQSNPSFACLILMSLGARFCGPRRSFVKFFFGAFSAGIIVFSVASLREPTPFPGSCRGRPRMGRLQSSLWPDSSWTAICDPFPNLRSARAQFARTREEDSIAGSPASLIASDHDP
jgi:hypothetical protein